MNRRVRITKRGPASPSISCDEECEGPSMWRQLVIGAAATAVGAMAAPLASRLGERIATTLLGPAEVEDDDGAVSLDEIVETLKTELKKDEES